MPINIYPSFYCPIVHIDGIGPVIAKKLQASGYCSVGSLLLHLPKSWVDDRYITPISALVRKQEARIAGTITSRKSHGFGRKTTVHITLSDDTGTSIILSFFHAKYMMSDARLAEGQNITVRGIPDKWGNKWQMPHPEWQPISHFEPCWKAKYASIAGYSGRQVGGWIHKGLQLIAPEAQSPLDKHLPNYPSLYQALHLLHNNARHDPESPVIQQALQRLQIEELMVYLQLMQQQRKQAEVCTTPLPTTTKEQDVIQSLPYTLTDAQRHVWQEIGDDLAAGKRMHRLLQGDVGAGKTWIAALAVTRLAAHGRQSALMAPTEVLAKQHMQTLCELLEPHHISVALLTGSTKKKERKSIIQSLATGDIDVLVGTHALLTSDVRFADLGLALVDEQHRFGVQQRWGLTTKNKKDAVHLLAMTATPIPRSLALALYGDMNLSIMRGLPKGRKQVDTRVVSESKLPALIDAIARMLAQNGRIYWIVPRIDEDEDMMSVDQRLNTLKQQFPDELILTLHGKMKPKDKQAALAAFANGSCRILVATTVVEVGVNIPEARVIVIEHADMYGLAQLHQLRGRVGRSSLQSYCILIPSRQASNNARKRLSLMTSCHDGLALAESDLAYRGAGDAIGTRQSGEAGFRLIDPARDSDLIRHWSTSSVIHQVCISEDMQHFWRPFATEVD